MIFLEEVGVSMVEGQNVVQRSHSTVTIRRLGERGKATGNAGRFSPRGEINSPCPYLDIRVRTNTYTTA